MTTYAIIDNAQIVGYRVIADSDWPFYAQHKKDALDEKGDGYPVLRPVEEIKPSYNPWFENMASEPTITILPDKVTKTWAKSWKPIEEIRANKIALAWQKADQLNESGFVQVTTSAGTHNYGIDKGSRDNIEGILIGVALGVTPNPRPWTPKGEIAPISVSHADLTLIGATMMAAVDANIQKYLAHKFAIMALTTEQEIVDYDLTLGWD